MQTTTHSLPINHAFPSGREIMTKSIIIKLHFLGSFGNVFSQTMPFSAPYPATTNKKPSKFSRKDVQMNVSTAEFYINVKLKKKGNRFFGLGEDKE